MSKIIYPHDGKVAIVYPNPRSPKTVMEIAKKSVPEGVPFRIVDDSFIPTDDTFFEAWEADFSKPDGIGEQKQLTNSLTG